VATRLDFEELIRQNRRWTWVLLAGAFGLLTIVGGVVSWALGGGWIGAAFGVAIALGLTLVSYYKADTLALRSTNARAAPVEQYLQLHNLVEAMAIAAGLPKPAVYVVEDPAPNAFATGRDPQHAAVAVTTGLLQKMNRDELEGVLAHELAHVRNYDIRVMTVAVATAGSVAVITDFFWRMMFWTAIAGSGRRRNNDRSGGSNPLALVAMLVVAVLAPIAAALLQAAISRKREGLADATAVALTRYPTGLRRALEKLDADSTVVRRTSHATSHLWIESPDERALGNRGARFNRMFSTHPPLSERINLLRDMEGLPPYTGPAPADASAGASAGTSDRPSDRAPQPQPQPEPVPARGGPASIAAANPAAASMPHLQDLFGPRQPEAAPDAAPAGPRSPDAPDARGAHGSHLPPPPPPPEP
jgi:heat shock protein HtpX